MPSRAQKRWSGRLRTGGALLLLAGAVGTLDRFLPHATDPVLGTTPFFGVALPIALLMMGALSLWLGRRWH